MSAKNKFLKLSFICLVLTLAAAGAAYWDKQRAENAAANFASGNGRLEATEIDLATKQQGRLEGVFVSEGDLVKEGQVLARMDSTILHAQLREAESEKRRVQEERNVVAAIIAQRESEHDYAEKVLKRSEQLASQKVIDQNQLDRDQTAERTANAMLIATRAQAVSADAAIESACAKIERIKTDIEDTILKSPRNGRVQYRLAEPGEVLGVGGKIVTLVDIADVYMTLFLPTKEAGRVAIGGEARIMLDALPNHAIPAKVSFVSPSAQFTPKEVETRSEREKLMFRVKVRIDPALLTKFADRVKAGLPGVAHVRLDETAAWPAYLQSDFTTNSLHATK